MTIIATGGVESIAAGYKIHTFTGNGTFTVTGAGNVEVLVVAGGASGAARVGGGGGAGGAVYEAVHAVIAQEYDVVIGPGGVAVTSVAGSGRAGNDGTDSSFDGLVADGGGGGGAYTTPANGRDGGCGGGAGGYTAGTAGVGTQGYNGGTATTNCSPGGGGLGAAGATGNSGTGTGGVGGAGVEYAMFASVGGGPAGWFCGGGGGCGNSVAGAGGNGGGGAGTAGSNTPAVSGTANTGGGGGGVRDTADAGNKISGAGGSGIVIIRYLLDIIEPPVIESPIVVVPSIWGVVRNSGPWNFTKPSAKRGYLNNPNWVVVPTADHKPCGYWFSSDISREVTYTGLPSDVAAWTSLAISGDGKYRTAIAANRIYTSSDYGMTWSNKLTITKEWLYVNMSITGQYQIAAGEYTLREVWVSSNYGITWSKTSCYSRTTSAIFSGSGQYQVISDSWTIYVSNDYGVTWALVSTTVEGSVLGSSSGQYILTTDGRVSYSINYGASFSGAADLDGASYIHALTMARNSGYCLGMSNYVDNTLWRSIDHGVNWVHGTAPGISGKTYTNMVISDTGQYQVIVWTSVWTPAADYVNFYVSNDYGVTWTKIPAVIITRTLLQMSTDGQHLSVLLGANVQISHDYGATWHLGTPPAITFTLKAMSSTGQYQIATGGTNSIYSSSDYGETWSTKATVKVMEEENFGQKMANPVWPLK